MEVRVLHGPGKQIETIARGHRILTDQPSTEGGDDAGMTPPELMLSALGACAMHYAAEYLRARNFPIDHLEVHVTAGKSGRPVRLIDFEITVDAPHLDERHREGLLRAVDACLIHRTLREPSEVKINIVSSTFA